MRPLLALLLALLALSPASAGPEGFARETAARGDGWELLRYRRGGEAPCVAHVFAVTDPARRRLEVVARGELTPHARMLESFRTAPVALLTGGFHLSRDGRPLALGAARGRTGESPSVARRFPLLFIARDGTAGISDDLALLSRKSLQVLQGKPRLLYGGKVSPRTADERTTRRILQPRAAIGFAKGGRALLVAVDGRSSESAGMTLPELAGFLRDLGATDALGMDGGGTALLVVEGRVVNAPSGGLDPFTLPGEPRPLLNAIVVR